jgi:hypothetical protein
MLETVGIVLAIIGVVFAFDAPRKRFVALFGKANPAIEQRASAAGLDATQLQILTILSEPHRDVPRTNYLAHRMKTHEYKVRIAGQTLEEKGIVHFVHFSPEDEYGLLLHEKGRRFVVEHKLLD